MIDTSNLPAIVLGGASGVAALVYAARAARRMFYTEKRDTSIDMAGQSLFENLRLENQRMSDQLRVMSEQLNLLSIENRSLNNKIAELTSSVRMLVTLERENMALQEIIISKDNEILTLSASLNEVMGVVKLRKNPREKITKE